MLDSWLPHPRWVWKTEHTRKNCWALFLINLNKYSLPHKENELKIYENHMEIEAIQIVWFPLNCNTCLWVYIVQIKSNWEQFFFSIWKELSLNYQTIIIPTRNVHVKKIYIFSHQKETQQLVLHSHQIIWELVLLHPFQTLTQQASQLWLQNQVPAVKFYQLSVWTIIDIQICRSDHVNWVQIDKVNNQP